MLKGNVHQAFKIENEERAKEATEKIASEWGFPLLLQKLIQGDELNLVGIGDGKGNLIGAVSIKKLTTTSMGKIWTAVSIEHEGMLELAKRFVRESSWYGAFELECMLQDNELHLIEINPRFPSWTYFATAIGVNLPKQLIKLANGMTIEPLFSYATGKLYIRFTDELITDFSDFSTLMTQKEL
jgi:carbamoyl-phosphate synthase large subunit